MKMLSVANIATLLGGTGRCAWDCIQAIPEWEHQILFINGNDSRRVEECRQAFPCDVFLGSGRVLKTAQAFLPDVVLYHNQSPREMPPTLPGKPIRVYYQHSPHTQHGRIDQLLMVSKALASRCGFGRDQVLYQPVSIPPKSVDRDWQGPVTIGKLCTPTPAKWPRESMAFYSRLLSETDARYEFVGAPDWFQIPMTERFGQRVGFHPASVDAQSLFWGWHAMLHDGPWESYGRTICEAQQAGCIPITRKRGGPCEQIEHGTTGFLCDELSEWISAVQEVIRWTQGGGGLFCVKSQLAAIASRDRGSLDGWRDRFLRRTGLGAQ